MAANHWVHPLALFRTLGPITSNAALSRLLPFESTFTANFHKGQGQCSKSVVRKKFTCYPTLNTLVTPATQIHQGTLKKVLKKVLQNRGQRSIDWWSLKLEHYRKPLTKEMMKRLKWSNPHGLNESLRGGSLKKGIKSAELLQMKTSCPLKVFLCRTGDVYKAVGIDTCKLWK